MSDANEFMSRVMSNLDGNKDARIASLTAALRAVAAARMPGQPERIMSIDERAFVKDLADLVKIGVEAERDRCVAICEGWIKRFGGTEIQYTIPREYACDAINDIIDLIRTGTDVGTRP